MNNTKRLIECVPNFSEGRDIRIIKQITDAIESVEDVYLLNVDPGEAANRTVVTFAGSPEAVAEAAFRAAKKASEVIDMRKHHGVHPRQGATDVMPLIPIEGITLEECVELARQLAQRMASEAGIPCYLYEAAALKPEHTNLARCRAGEYEALYEKMTNPDKQPDCMPAVTIADGQVVESIQRCGCSVVGARNYLIAVNFNLNTTSTRHANAIAFDVREKGRPLREGGLPNGAIIRDENGKPRMKPGTLRCTKAIGWYIKEYGVAQVSMNITDIQETPLHKAFDEVCFNALNKGIRVTGTEIIGLLPKRSLIEAGKFFLEKQHRSIGIPEEDIIKIAIKSLGLDDLRPFNPREKVIEYRLEDLLLMESKARSVTDLTIHEFANELSRERTAPGGGAAVAFIGAMGAALGSMVANMTGNHPELDERWEEFSQYAAMGQDMMIRLQDLIDDHDIPATHYAALADIAMRTMRAAMQVFVICRTMVRETSDISIADAGIATMAARTAVIGAGLKVKSFARMLDNREEAEKYIAEAESLMKRAETSEQEILAVVSSKL